MLDLHIMRPCTMPRYTFLCSIPRFARSRNTTTEKLVTKFSRNSLNYNNYKMNSHEYKKNASES